MEYDSFFDELARGERPLGDECCLQKVLHRNPPDLDQAIWQVGRIANHAAAEICDCLETIQNIMRWHGPDEIKERLRKKPGGDQILDLLVRLRAVVDDERKSAG
jgi:hypothetical protein